MCSSSPALEADKSSYTVGTLKYTLLQVIGVSAMLILARQAMATVCYAMVPTVTPLLLRKIEATPTQIALICSTIPSILSFFATPLISTLSDKTRTKIGRRMPYLIWSAPALALTLVLLGYSGDIANVCAKAFPAVQCNWPFWSFVAAYMLFQIAFQFPSSIIYYLDPDVLPQKVYGRFSAAVSIFNAAFGAAFNYYLLKPSVEHMKSSMIIFGAIYFLIYFLLFVFVKEGEYPPVEDNIDHSQSWMVRTAEYLRLFFRQFFSHRIFTYLALCIGFNAASTICRDIFNVLFATEELKIDIGALGKINAIGSIISACLIYFFGLLMDMTHPMFIYFIGGILVMIGNVFGYFFIHDQTTYMCFAILIKLMYAFQFLAQTPLQVKLLPMDKFGQFASSNAMLRDVILIGASALGGYLTSKCGYRVMFVWDFFVTALATLMLVLVYFEWKKFGGRNYQAPPVDD